MLIDILQKVRHRWATEKITLATPLPGIELEKNFKKLGVPLTDEIRTVFSILNGFADYECDSRNVSFWSVERMMVEKSERWGDTSMIHFADFLIMSHAYAFRLDDYPIASIYCDRNGTTVEKICDSLETFFEYYLTDNRKLFI